MSIVKKVSAMVLGDDEQRMVRELTIRSKRSRIAQRATKPWYILAPDNKMVQMRDLVNCVALCLIFFVLPYEVGFVKSPEIPDPLDGFFIFARITDVIFLLDLIMQFFVAYPRDPFDEEAELEAMAIDNDALSKVTKLEFRFSRIALSYLKGWLLLDFLAMLPSAVDIYFAVVLNADGADAILASNATAVARIANGDGDGAPSGLSGLRVVRVVKLTKFMRMARILKILRLIRLTKTFKMFTQNDFFKQTMDTIAVALIEHTRKLRILKL